MFTKGRSPLFLKGFTLSAGFEILLYSRGGSLMARPCLTVTNLKGGSRICKFLSQDLIFCWRTCRSNHLPVLCFITGYLKVLVLLRDRACNITFHGPHSFLSCSLSGLYFHAKYYWIGNCTDLTLDSPYFILFLARRGKNEWRPMRILTIFLQGNCSCAETTHHLWKIKLYKAVSPCWHNMVQVRPLSLGQRSQAPSFDETEK